ncbi:unnamed protein product [Rhizoctonia solani]|uniref:BTB domain-containing protein n=1 Tax=Rhizoctonia solani TaxID=456999 RepID=A0A8H3DL35_9AGAM|nr:unnamed protein product [Rhizoctonia solani]
MPKRSSTASRRSTKTRAQKRAKVNETEESPLTDLPEETKRETSPEENHEEDGTDASLIRDPMYYFDDGNTTFRVLQVLFKVHSSLLKAHSVEFFSKLNPSQQTNGSNVPRGTSDRDAIVIPDIQPSQFRHLMKVVYCLPDNNVVFGANQAIVGMFECYLDVAVLSRKFAMEAMHQWAQRKLADIAYGTGKPLADQLNTFYNEAYESTNNIYRDNDLPSDSHFSGFFASRLITAIQYARTVSRLTLLYNLLSIMEYYSSFTHPNLEYFSAFFRIEDLRTTEPSLFGFFFLLLLNCGNQMWVDKVFTQEERMALFSAQSFLTPLPESLKASVFAPLFIKPTNSNEFAAILSESKCENGCHKDIFSYWQKSFPVSYYRDVNSREFSVSIKALTTLPLHRLNFVSEVSRVRCLPCRRKIIRKLDEDMQEVFARLAGYYKVYD